MQDRFGAIPTASCVHAAAQTRKVLMQCALFGVSAHRVQPADFDRIDDVVRIPHSAK
jgi:hypothetical protein